MTARSTTSFVINSLIIFSTIPAWDFRDEIGDRPVGWRTVPTVWPNGSRISIFAVLITWSVGLSWACDLVYHISVASLRISGLHRAALCARVDSQRRRPLIVLKSACLLAMKAMRRGKA